jgi:hypothetical protein
LGYTKNHSSFDKFLSEEDLLEPPIKLRNDELDIDEKEVEEDKPKEEEVKTESENTPNDEEFWNEMDDLEKEDL